MTAESSPSLSVVVVTLDEADRVAACLDSVLDLCRGVLDFEIILVDSNSSDETVDIACEYPITVLRIPDDDLTTPGAGRYVGSQHVEGDLVLFVDGDMRLADGWLEHAVQVVSDPHVAGVDGYLDESPTETAHEVDALRGVALYDADVLAEIGAFDPLLKAWEDIELGYRLTMAGYRLVRLPTVIAKHPTSPNVFEQFRRWRNGYYFGSGQVVMKALRSPSMLSKWAVKFRYPLAATAWQGVCLAALLTFDPLVMLGGVGVSLVAFVGLALARGVGWTLDTALSYSLFPIGFILGVLQYSLVEEFPLGDVEVLQSEPAIYQGTTPADAETPPPAATADRQRQAELNQPPITE